MADLKKTVELIFGGKDNTGSAITSVGRNLDNLQNKVGDFTSPLASATDMIVKLDTALAAAAVGITGYAIKISDDFQTAFAEIASIIDAPAGELEDFQAALLQYSEQSSQSLEQITNATYAAISAGVDYKDSIELIAAAEQLAVAGRADLGSTTTALVSTLNAFGASADEAGAYADDFFTAVKLGQTTIPELSEAIGRLSPIAAAAGVDFDEMAAAIATITAETGTSTREAITGLRAAINSLLKPSQEATKLADELGVEFNATALESKGFAGVLQDVLEATGGNTEQMARLFGSVEALAPVLALTGNASEAFAENLKAFEDNAGAAGNAADLLAADLSKITQTLKNNLNSALIGFAGNLTDETQSIVKSVSSIFNSLGDEIRLEDGVFAPILEGMEGLAQDIDLKLQRIAENFPEALEGIDVSGLLAAFGDLGDELEDLVTGLFGDIDLSTVEGLQDAMQKVIDAFTALINVSAGIANGLEPLFQAIGAGIEQFQSWDESTKKTVGEILGLGKAIDTVLPVVGGLAGGLESVGNGLVALAGAQGFKSLIGNLNTIKSIASTTAGKGGLLGLALTGGYAFGTWLNDLIEENFGSIGSKLYEYLNADEIAAIAEQFAPLTGEAKKLAGETAELNEITQRYTEMSDELGQKLGYTTAMTEEQRQEFNRYADELVESANKAKEFSGSQRDVTSAVQELNREVSDSGGALGEVSKTTKKLADNNRSLQLGYDETTGKINSFSGTIVKSGEAVEDTTEKTKELVKQSEAYQIKMLEIASDERIAQIEAKVSLDIAEVEANADKVVALAETIGQAFTDSTELVGDLFGGFDDASRSTQIELAKQIRQENEFREEQLELTKKMTEAEIEYIREKTRQLANGDALIKVDAPGLEPHLEAIWYQILGNLQVRVNADGEEMLLGLRT